MNNDKRTQRMGFAATLAAAALVSLGLLAGVGFAGSSVSAAQYQYGPKGKTTICHKGKTITVGNPAVKAHLRHGDTVGPCASTAAKAKKAKQKAKGKKAETQQPASAPKQKGDKDHGKPADPGSQGNKPADPGSQGNGKGKGK